MLLQAEMYPILASTYQANRRSHSAAALQVALVYPRTPR